MVANLERWSGAHLNVLPIPGLEGRSICVAAKTPLSGLCQPVPPGQPGGPGVLRGFLASDCGHDEVTWCPRGQGSVSGQFNLGIWKVMDVEGGREEGSCLQLSPVTLLIATLC